MRVRLFSHDGKNSRSNHSSAHLSNGNSQRAKMENLENTRLQKLVEQKDRLIEELKSNQKKQDQERKKHEAKLADKVRRAEGKNEGLKRQFQRAQASVKELLIMQQRFQAILRKASNNPCLRKELT